MLVAGAAISFLPAGNSSVDRARADALLSPKGDLDEMKVGRNAEAAIGANEQRNPDGSPRSASLFAAGVSREGHSHRRELRGAVTWVQAYEDVGFK